MLPINEVKGIMAEADIDQDGQLNYKGKTLSPFVYSTPINAYSSAPKMA